MWDLRYKFSHGRLSMRRISLLATTFVLALFMTTISFSQPALAADATRTGDTVSYKGMTLTQLKSSDKLPSGLPSDTSGYEYADSSKTKTYFILTAGDPAKADSGQYVTYDGLPTTDFSHPADQTTVSIANGTTSNSSANGNSTSCDGSITNGIGWILCPVVNFLASGMDHLYTILASFLEVQPVQSNNSGSLYHMWTIIRDIANVSFVIAFLVIVYSQITSLGISNYNVKRMLPRLIIAAILVNISYWISALAVDISNLLGYSIHDIFLGLFTSLNKSSHYSEIKWSDVSGFILSGGTIGALGAYGIYSVLAASLTGSLILLIPALVGVLIAALIAILIMAARQALIVCLIIVSPLAFVAFLLPNTEKYFDKWKDLFMTMLLLFPIFSVLFGAAQLAGLAIIQNAPPGPNKLNIIILGMTVIVAPVIITPMLVKFSGTFLGRIAGMANNPKKGIMDKTRNWAQSRSQEEKARILAGKSRNTWVNRSTQAIDRRRRTREGYKKAWEEIADVNYGGTEQGQALEALRRDTAINKQRIDNAFGRTAVGQKLDIEHRRAELEKHQVESEHEAHWNTRVITNPELLRESIDARSAEVRSELAKGRLDKVNAEIAAQGENSEYILNLRGVAPQDQAGLLNVARDIKTGTFDTYLEASAKNMADRKIASNRATSLKEESAIGDALRRRASGIMHGEGGEQSIRAQARREASKYLADDAQNIEATTDNKLATNVDWLYTQLTANPDLKFAERIAYSNLLAKAGGPGASNLKKAIARYDKKLADTGELRVSQELQDYKDFMRSNSQFMGLGKDLEFWATNDSIKNPDGTAAVDASGNVLIRSFDEITKSSSTWSNVSAENLTNFNVASQFRMFNVLYETNRPLYDQLLSSLRDNDNLLFNKLKPSIRNKISAVEAGTERWSSIPPDLFDK